MNPEEYATLLAFATAMSFTPGPNTMLATALAANAGLGRALRFVVAVPAGWLVMTLASGWGLGALVLALPWARNAVKLAGVLYLIWLAWQLARTRSLARAPTAGSGLRIGFWQGFGLQFVNVKAWMLTLTAAAGWVTTSAGHASANPGERLAIVCAVMAAFALTSNAAYALAGSLLRRWLAHGDRLVGFNRAMALVLLATALWMLGA